MYIFMETYTHIRTHTYACMHIYTQRKACLKGIGVVNFVGARTKHRVPAGRKQVTASNTSVHVLIRSTNSLTNSLTCK